MRMLDLFCGRWGWSTAFSDRGWDCVGIDLVENALLMPAGAFFVRADILKINILGGFDFICASSPCEEFSVHGLKMWHKNPKHPALGVDLFEHTRMLCEASGVPYVMENVRSAQQFVGKAVSHCGPFYLWGNAVPPLLNQGITKGSMIWSPRYRNMKKSQRKQEVATIPSELAGCVADYATRICTDGASSQLMRRELVKKTPLFCQKPSSTKEDHG